MKRPKPKPFVPGLVRGQLQLRSPLRDACTVEVTLTPELPCRIPLDYPSHAETPNEKSKRQLARSMPKVRVSKAIVQFTLKTGDWIL